MTKATELSRAGSAPADVEETAVTVSSGSEASPERFAQRLLGGDFLLWSPAIQSEGFLNWERIFATRPIHRRDPRPLPLAATELDIAFESGGISRNIDDLMRSEFLSGLLVVKDGRIHLERYARGLTAAGRWQSSSMVKSLGSILIGAAIHDGSIPSVNALVTNYLPELAGTAYEGVTIRHLLHMASGVTWTENTNDTSTDVYEHYIRPIAAREPHHILRYLASRPRAAEPGTTYFYNSGDLILLSYIITRATGQTVADYCSEKVWGPMGCEQDGYFLLDADDGVEVIGSCGGASLRDYARWGILMLADGVAGGQRILPEGWVAESTTPSAPGFEVTQNVTRGPSAEDNRQPWQTSFAYTGYGYLWWLSDDGTYRANGSFGQMIHIDPTNNAVVVMLGAVPRAPYQTPEVAALHHGFDSGSPMRAHFIAAALQALS